MAYNTKNLPFCSGCSQRFWAMPPVILRDGIAHSGGKCVANEPLTPSERRERAFFRSGPRPKWHPLKSQKGAKIMKNHEKSRFLTVFDALRSPIGFSPVYMITTHKYYRLEPSETDPNTLHRKKHDFLDLKPTYNHRSHHGASLCSEPKSENHRF